MTAIIITLWAALAAAAWTIYVLAQRARGHDQIIRDLTDKSVTLAGRNIEMRRQLTDLLMAKQDRMQAASEARRKGWETRRQKARQRVGYQGDSETINQGAKQ